MRCWRKGAAPAQAERTSTQAGSSGIRGDGSGSASSGDGGASSGSVSPRKRRQQGEGTAAKRQTAAAGGGPSGGVPGGSVSGAVDRWARGKDLGAMLCALQPFAHVLGEVPPATAPADLRPQAMRAAYRRACLQLHPDRHVGSSPHTRAVAEELFKVLSAAYVDHQCASQLCSPAMAC